MTPQSWDPQTYGRNARFVSDLGGAVLELLSPQKGERILDLGCGDGVLTKKLADLGAQVVGVDASPEFIAAAKALGLDARLMDGQALTFEMEFDAVFSNAALHWMKDLEAVVRGVERALKPGGRFVAEMGGQGNIQTIEAALRAALQARGLAELPDPNRYPSAEEFRGLLERQGFRVDTIALIPRPTPLPGDLKAWVSTFRKSYLEALPPADRPAFLEEVQEALRPRLSDAQGRWSADYVRLRFKAVKP